MAAEFALKSFLLANAENYKKYGHDLSAILSACQALIPPFEEIRGFCEQLEHYKTTTEYAEPPGSVPSLQEARQAIESAEAVWEFVGERLKTSGFLE